MSERFNITFQSVRDKAYRFALRMLNNPDDAMDVVQDLFEKLWRMNGSLQKYDNLEAVSMQMVKNQSIDIIRKRKLTSEKLKDLGSTESFSESNSYEMKSTANLIKELIQDLPEKQRMILHLRDVEGYEMEEIAEVVEMQAATVRVNLSRGRKTVKEELIKRMRYGTE